MLLWLNVISAKEGTNSILLPMDLEWDVIKAPVGVVYRCVAIMESAMHHVEIARVSFASDCL